MHFAAAGILIAVLPYPAGICIAILLIVLAAITARDRTLLLAPDSTAALELGREGTLTLRQRDGKQLVCQAGSRRYVSRWLVVLALRLPDGRTRTVLVARDMLGAEGFRRLRLWTLWNALPAAPGAAIA